ncbi:MoxR family ATPase [Bacillus shivajii]|uniref:AAA family ATPase n=1 Tax=Bacillus shivajii TaxID=1983719 RepID=UPI001CFC3DE1|nr:MoxR family ATPase [Bacillus shivajii]UCZ52428.1 MoxR family ATPase [Bacillus shivajii]
MNNEQKVLKTISERVSQVLVGKEELTEMMMVALLSKGHILLEDVPGTGKTMFAKSIAKCIDASFKRVQFTPDVLPNDVTGIQFFNPKEKTFELRPGPVMTNILLTDEINRATPRTQSSLLEVMEEGQVTIDGETLPLPEPFIVIATQNPVESQQGTFDLPEAQMDRFLMQIRAGYPSLEEEQQMLKMYKKSSPIESIEPVVTLDEIKKMQQEVKKVTLNEAVEKYLLAIIQATRESEDTELGVSPRGTLAFMYSSQAFAYLQGRTYVIPEDVKKLAPYVLAHRLVLTLDSSMKKTKQDVLKTIIKQIEVPVEAGNIK